MFPQEDCDTLNQQPLQHSICTLDGFNDRISKLFKAQTRILTIEINIKLLQHDIGEVI